MSRQSLSQEELSQQLCAQIRFLRKSCEEFDRGEVSEGKRIAIQIRILVHHHPPNSHSLLVQLGYRDVLKFVSRAEASANRRMPRLLNIALGKPLRYSPKLNEGQARLLSFDTWWDETVLTDADGTHYTREKLVLSVADMDGGAHVDPKMDHQYWKLSRQNRVGLQVTKGGKAFQWHENPVLPSLRHIGFEILETLGSLDEAR